MNILQAIVETGPTDNPAFRKWFDNSKVVDGNGQPLKMYHGSSSDIEQFSHSFTGKGLDQNGAGFYFTNDPTDASAYTSGDGGNVSPVYLSIQNPLDSEAVGRITAAQVRKIILQSPILDDALSNWGDVDHEGYERVLAKACQAYVVQGTGVLLGLHPICNDFFGDEHSEEFLTAVHKTLGYDGVVANHLTQHYVAWFPYQIKSIFNKGTYRGDHLSEDVQSSQFKRWFGSSKVIDDTGRPLKVYHGTNQPIEKFLKDKLGSATGNGAGAQHGFFFTENPDVAGMYAAHAGNTNKADIIAHEKKSEEMERELTKLERQQRWDEYETLLSAYEDHELNGMWADPLTGQNVVPVYLSIKNPLILDFKGGYAGSFSIHGDLNDVLIRAKKDGHDGLFMLNVDDTPAHSVVTNHYVIFNPHQAKSVFNRGTYSGDHLSESVTLPDGVEIEETHRPRSITFLIKFNGKPVNSVVFLRIDDQYLEPHGGFPVELRRKGLIRYFRERADEICKKENRTLIKPGHLSPDGEKAWRGRNYFRGPVQEDGPVIDNHRGMGATGYNGNIDYMGLKVMMTPSKFLDLAQWVNSSPSEEMKSIIKSGQGIGSPFLLVNLPDEWLDDDYSRTAVVRGHEGRHRMKAIQELYGDIPVEVHIIPDMAAKELRARHIKPEWIKSMAVMMRAEKTLTPVMRTFTHPLLEQRLTEMPIQNWTVDDDFDSNEKEMMSDFKGYSEEKPHWSDLDKKIINNAGMIKHIKDVFNRVSYDFNFYFWQSKNPDYDQTMQIGLVSTSRLHKLMGEKASRVEATRTNDNITVIFTNNLSDEHHISFASPWLIAHRLSHTFIYGRKEINSSGFKVRQEFLKFIQSITKAYGVKWPDPNTMVGFHMTDEYEEIYQKVLGHHLGTMKSAREGKLVQGAEWINETFAQYLITGKVTLNPLPSQIHAEEQLTSDPIKLARAQRVMDQFPKRIAKLFDKVLEEAKGGIWMM